MTQRIYYIPNICLQLCAEGAGAASGGEGTGETGVTKSAAGAYQGVKSNPLADVQYGIQDDEQAAAAEGTVEAPDLNADFESMIKGKYKEQYNQRVQDTVQKRLKGTQEIVQKYESLSPILETLASKYGVKPDDIAGLSKAIEDDNTFYEEEAMEKGISVEQLKEIRRMERENADLKRQMEEKSNRENASRLYAQWMDQAKSTQAVYPSFDLKSEMQNQKFVDLLRSNIDVKTAYEVIHKDEILPAAMQFAVSTAQQKLTNKIISGGGRPKENGTSSQGPALVKSDPSTWTKEDRQEVIRRVQRGAKIRL